MSAYYNEFDKKTASWLRELINQGLIADGIVDDRSITDVTANDLRGFTQCHFFAGIGVWSYALRQAGWSDDKPVWTGSCPCQPFSVAGKGKGTDDERHLWPVLRELVAQHKPPVFFGEQVAAKAGRSWINTVRLEMEALGYGVGIADLCAAGVGAPHIRQRLFFVGERVGNSIDQGLERLSRNGNGIDQPGRLEEVKAGPVTETIGSDRLADANRHGCDEARKCESEAGNDGLIGDCAIIRLADSDSEPTWRDTGSPRCEENKINEPEKCDDNGLAHDVGNLRPNQTNGKWSNPDWLFCRDGKWRPVEPGTSPLVNGASNRVVKLRGYGNAIVSEVAKEFISAYMEVSNV